MIQSIRQGMYISCRIIFIHDLYDIYQYQWRHSASSEEIAASAQEMDASMDTIASAAQKLSIMTKVMKEQVERYKTSTLVSSVENVPDIVDKEPEISKISG